MHIIIRRCNVLDPWNDFHRSIGRRSRQDLTFPPARMSPRFPHVNGMIFVRRLDSWDLLTFRPLINVEEAGDRVSGTLRCTRAYIVLLYPRSFPLWSFPRSAKRIEPKREVKLSLLAIWRTALWLRNLRFYHCVSIGRKLLRLFFLNIQPREYLFAENTFSAGNKIDQYSSAVIIARLMQKRFCC